MAFHPSISVLVLERDASVAGEACDALQDAGLPIVGPFFDAAGALAQVDRQAPSCALVDVDLGRGPYFAAARALLARGVPLAFIIGYACGPIPADLEHIPRLLKPVDGRKAIAAVRALCRPA